MAWGKIMTPGQTSALPQPSLACLTPLAEPEILAAWIAAQPKERCAPDAAAKVLAPLFPFEPAVEEAKRLRLISEQDGLLAAVDAPSPKAGLRAPYAAPAREALRAIAIRALKGQNVAAAANGNRNRRDLPALALRQLYEIEELSGWPSAQQVRCALLSRVVASFGGPFAKGGGGPLKTFKFDEMSRRIYLAFAGLERGTVLQADAALLSKGLGGPSETVQALTATIIRAAIKARTAQPAEAAPSFNIEGFALAVRKLAARLETKPYAGRVAIAQVYDAGLAEGLAFGSLDEFKANLAEAAREGLLDLERYDITGPFDAGLKERSRLRLGRDERHFIVNQWI